MPKMRVGADSRTEEHRGVRINTVALVTAALVAFICCGCSVTMLPESERALETEVARQATELAGLLGEREEPSPSVTVAPILSPSAAPTVTQLVPTATPAEPSPTSAPVPTATETDSGSVPQPCEIIAEGEVTAYARPSSAAMVFGTMYPGLRVRVEGRTADGWLGFEPGVAQAANVGIFRLRWVHESSAIRVEGTCDELPELVGPAPAFCFTMPMEEVLVYTEPAASSGVLATLTLGDYAAVLGMTVDAWARVDLSVGNTDLHVSGWVQEATLNLNGPCDRLPTVEP
jgi:hypothetical protein